MNQYQVREQQIQNLIQQRQLQSQQRQQWDYGQLTRGVMMAPRFKYQNVQMSYQIQFIDQVRNIIYDQRTNVQDANLLTKWSIAPFQQKPLKIPEDVPPQFLILKDRIDGTQFDQFFGKFQMQGKIMAKSNQINYKQYHYNLRTNSLFFYPSNPQQLSKCQKPLFYFILNQRSYDYLSFNTEYFMVKSDQKTAKIKRDQLSYNLIKILQKKLLLFSYRGAYGLRDQVPPWQLDDYLVEEVDTIGPINFQKQSHLKGITKSKYYKEAMGSFFTLLKKYSDERANRRGQIFLPRWLKSQIRELPDIQMSLITNVVPMNNSLNSLTIKIQPFQLQSLINSLKYIFPFNKNYLKRTFIVYDSDLQDENVKYILSQISYPMYMIGFPRNNLSLTSLEQCIEAASNLYHEEIDFSYNKRLMSLGDGRIFSLLNNNPSIKKLLVKGSYVQDGEEDRFFEAFTNNLCLSQFQCDFLDHYGLACINHLNKYTAYLY